MLFSRGKERHHLLPHIIPLVRLAILMLAQPGCIIVTYVAIRPWVNKKMQLNDVILRQVSE